MPRRMATISWQPRSSWRSWCCLTLPPVPPGERGPGLSTRPWRPPAPAIYRKIVHQVMLGLATLAAVAALGALLLVLIYPLIQGFHSLNVRIPAQGPTPMGVPGGGL